MKACGSGGFVASLILALLVAQGASAGQFFITRVDFEVNDEDTTSISIIATTVAQFNGAVNLSHTRWDLNTGARQSGGVWRNGIGTSGTGFSTNMIVMCETNCGGGKRVDKCKDGGPNAYQGRGVVSIDHNSELGDSLVTLPVQTDCLESPPGGNEAHEGQDTDCGGPPQPPPQ